MRREIFVFGSNLAGRHGAGAALFAAQFRGAEEGVGEGLTGDSYALPTKDYHIRTMALPTIKRHIATFLGHAAMHPENLYLLTPIGCGLAGYTRPQISSILNDLEMPDNVVLTREWIRDYK